MIHSAPARLSNFPEPVARGGPGRLGRQ